MELYAILHAAKYVEHNVLVVMTKTCKLLNRIFQNRMTTEEMQNYGRVTEEFFQNRCFIQYPQYCQYKKLEEINWRTFMIRMHNFRRKTHFITTFLEKGYLIELAISREEGFITNSEIRKNFYIPAMHNHVHILNWYEKEKLLPRFINISTSSFSEDTCLSSLRWFADR